MLVEPPLQHLWVPAHAGGPVPERVRLHRSRPIAPPLGGVESVADMLAHVAGCLPRLEALVVWESALHRRLVSLRQLARITWRGPLPREFARVASDRSESLLETLALHRLRAIGVPVRQQVPLRGHRVDLLLDERVVVQVDGFQHHTAGQRRSDIEHDALLGLDGFRVLRFGYGDIVDRWPHAEGTVVATLAQR